MGEPILPNALLLFLSDKTELPTTAVAGLESSLFPLVPGYYMCLQIPGYELIYRHLI
jgi:hypothetical protein